MPELSVSATHGTGMARDGSDLRFMLGVVSVDELRKLNLPHC